MPDWTAPKPDFLDEDLTPVKQFERFFNEEVLDHLVKQMNLYAQQCGEHNFITSVSEMRAFVGILFASSYALLPRRPVHWENESDVHNEAIASTMSRNRFDQMMKFLYLADNTTLTPGDKLTKVRPLFDILNQRFIKYFPMTQDVSID